MAHKPWCSVSRWRQVESVLDAMCRQAKREGDNEQAAAYLTARRIMGAVERQAREGRHEWPSL